MPRDMHNLLRPAYCYAIALFICLALYPALHGAPPELARVLCLVLATALLARGVSAVIFPTE